MAVPGPPRLGHGDVPFPGQVLARQGCGICHDLLRGAGGHQPSAGLAAAALGSDFDGIERTPLDCTGPQDVPRILDALRALGYPEETVRGIAGENFIAYFERLEA